MPGILGRLHLMAGLWFFVTHYAGTAVHLIRTLPLLGGRRYHWDFGAIMARQVVMPTKSKYV